MSPTPELLMVLITAAQPQTAAATPMPTPVVSRQPRMPAPAIGTPTMREKPIHMRAGRSKLEPLPSVAGPCKMEAPEGSKTWMVPVSLFTVNEVRGRRVGGVGDAAVSVENTAKSSQKNDAIHRVTAAIAKSVSRRHFGRNAAQVCLDPSTRQDEKESGVSCKQLEIRIERKMKCR